MFDGGKGRPSSRTSFRLPLIPFNHIHPEKTAGALAKWFCEKDDVVIEPCLVLEDIRFRTVRAVLLCWWSSLECTWVHCTALDGSGSALEGWGYLLAVLSCA